MGNIVIIDYDAGNVRSVIYAFERLGITPELTSDPGRIRAADKVILPGVGEASSAMRALHARGLDTLIPTLWQPVLGICLGMQLLADHSAEGDAPCLGIIPGTVQPFREALPDTTAWKVPQIGWNRLRELKGPLFEGIKDGDYAYFVHSYYLPLEDYTAARTTYGIKFSAAVQHRNFFACQFHPEKSGLVGERILRNFAEM